MTPRDPGVWGAPRIGPFGPIGPMGRRYVTWKKKMENEKSPTRLSGAAGLFCVRVLLATRCTLRVCDSADRLHAEAS